MLQRLAAWCYGRRRRVVVLWIVALTIVGAIGSSVGSTFSEGFSLSGTEAQRAADLLQSRFPARAGDEGQIVFADAGGVRDAAVQARMEALFAEVAKVPRRHLSRQPVSRRRRRASRPHRCHRLRDRAVRPGRDQDPRRHHRADPRPRRRRRGQGRARRARRSHVPRGRRNRAGRAHRHPCRNRDPAAHVRLAAGHGAPDPRRALRDRDRPGLRAAAQPRDRHARRRDPAGVDDRNRRRHRLRALHRHAVPPGPERGAGAGARGRARGRYRRPCRGVRRMHRGHLPARPLPDGRRLRERNGGRHVGHRRHRAAGLRHAAPRDPRLRGPHHRSLLGAPEPGREAARAEDVVPLEPRRTASAVAGLRERAGDPGRARVLRCCRCASRSPTRAAIRPATPRARPTTSSPTASGRGSTGR